MQIQLTGAIQTRAGTSFICETKTPGETVGMFPFVFNVDQTYQILVGNLYMWVIKDQVLQYEASKNVSAITLGATTTVTTSSSHGYSTGNVVKFTSLGGTTQLNGRQLKVTVTSATQFTLSSMAGVALDSSAYTAYTSGGTVAKVYEITSPYVTADLPLITFAQSADVVYLAAKGYEARKLSRTGDITWTLATVQFNNIYAPRALAGSVNSGTTTTGYQVTSIYRGDAYAQEDHESLPGTATAKTITGVTNANPCVVTCAAHGYSTGDWVFLDNIGGTVELNKREFQITVASAYVPDTQIVITSITRASPMVVTKNSHGLSDGDKVIFEVTGMTPLNEITYATVTNAAANTFQVYYFGTTTKIDSSGYPAFTSGAVTRISPNPTSTNTFTLTGLDTTGYGVYTSGGYAGNTTVRVTGAEPSSSNPVTLTWTATDTGLSGASSVSTKFYNIYKNSNGTFNWIGTTADLTFVDKGVTSTSIDTPLTYRELFYGTNNWPWQVIFHQQRLSYWGTYNKPDSGWLSAQGDYQNFSIHNPVRDGDAVSITLASNQVNEIRAIASMRRLIVFTSGAEWVVNGNDQGVITPTAINAEVDDEVGAAAIRPVVYGSRILFIQAKGSLVRDLGYNFSINGYDGYDKTVYSSKLFQGFSITGMAFQKTPIPILWAIRSDGKVLSMTYSPEQKADGWTLHDTDGLFENVSVVPEGETGETVYFVVNHGGTRYVECLNTRIISTLADYVGMDCVTIRDGTNTTAAQVRLEGPGAPIIPSWTAGTLLIAHADTAVFGDVVVGDAIWLVDPADDTVTVKATVVQLSSTVRVYVRTDIDVPVTLRAVYTTGWSYAALNIGNCWQNEGVAVSILGDGSVVASPNNDDYSTITVTNGIAVCPVPLVKAIVGRPYICSLETLAIDTAAGETLMDKKILINSATVMVDQSAGGFIGCAAPDDETVDPLQDLSELIVPIDNDFGDPVELQSGDITAPMYSEWGRGVVFIQIVDPLPFTLLALGSSGYLPFRNGG